MTEAARAVSLRAGVPVYRYRITPGGPPVSVLRLDAHHRPGEVHRHIHDFPVLVYVERAGRLETGVPPVQARDGDAYVLGSKRATKLMIDSLAIDRLRRGADVIRDCKQIHIGKARGRLPDGSRLIAQSAEIPAPVYIVGGAAAATAALLLRLRGGSR